MATSDDFLKFRGKLGDLIFFTRNGKTFVKRKAGGFVNGKSNEHPNTKAVQKNFSEVASFVKRFKDALFPIIWRQKDGTFHNQLVALFFKIKKASPDGQLYTAFKEGFIRRYMQYIPLNKNTVLNGRDCYYNEKTNKIQIDTALIYKCKEKFSDGYLEVNTAWLRISNTLELSLDEVNTEYIHLKEISNVTSSIEIPFSKKETLSEDLVYPLISLVVVYKSEGEAIPYHSYRYTLITFL